VKIAIVSGGTGGHIYPGIAIAEEIKKRDPLAQVLFIGSKEGLEKDIVAKKGYRLKLIRSRALLRKLSYKAVSSPFICGIGFFQALFILNTFSPKVLVSTGGYASLPAVLAAKLLSIPIFVCEQNVLPGMVNRFCAKIAKKVFLSFPDSLTYIKGEVVGNPVRPQIIAADAKEARQKLNLRTDKKVVLVMGGSQGSEKINQAVVASIPNLPQDVYVLHIVGHRDFCAVNSSISARDLNNYKAVAYIDDMAVVLAAADLVISRAGATAISEFLVRGLPMVLIPFPYAASDHQSLNANSISKMGAAIVIADSDFTAEKFIKLVSDSSINYAKMGKAAQALAKLDASERIVNSIYA